MYGSNNRRGKSLGTLYLYLIKLNGMPMKQRLRLEIGFFNKMVDDEQAKPEDVQNTAMIDATMDIVEAMEKLIGALK